MYLPAKYIYHDEKELNWFPKIDSTYNLSGGNLYQASKYKNGNYVFKYLEGVSIIQIPAFFIAHFMSSKLGYPSDGFSLPYQYAIAFVCLIWCIISFIFLRKILLIYFEDWIVSLVLLLVTLATNLIQYVALEGGQSHGYIFPLYVYILFFTIKWHETFQKKYALIIGLIIGLASISRPTEVVMLFIPLLWNMQTKAQRIEKINYLKNNYSQLLIAIAGLIIGIIPQLLYWKRITGSFIYDVGSKWDFLNPHFRVLFGWEKGWFIYTPITILFVLGLFFIKKYNFYKSILTFCLINIYIVIAWHIWRYGGSYSTRALVQSYPIFALPFGALLHYLHSKKILNYLIPVFPYLIYVNIFQIGQYNKTILHYDDMNRTYYSAIYLNNNPTA